MWLAARGVGRPAGAPANLATARCSWQHRQLRALHAPAAPRRWRPRRRARQTPEPAARSGQRAQRRLGWGRPARPPPPGLRGSGRGRGERAGESTGEECNAAWAAAQTLLQLSGCCPLPSCSHWPQPSAAPKPDPSPSPSRPLERRCRPRTLCGEVAQACLAAVAAVDTAVVEDQHTHGQVVPEGRWHPGGQGGVGRRQAGRAEGRRLRGRLRAATAACSCPAPSARHPPAHRFHLHAAEAKGAVALHRHHGAAGVHHSGGDGRARAHAHRAPGAGVDAAPRRRHRLEQDAAGGEGSRQGAEGQAW